MRSLSWRLTLWYAAVLLTVLSICGAVAFWGVRYILFTGAAREAEAAVATVQRLTGGGNEQGDYNHMDLDDPEFATILGSNLLWVQITAPDGRVLNRSHALQGDVRAPAYLGPAVQGRLGDQDVILVGGQLADGVRVQVIRPLEREEKFLATLTRVFILVALAGLVPAVVGGRAIARAALRPVETLTRTARDITASDLSRRIPLRGPRDELYVLGEAVNAMLGRLEDGFSRQREFVAAASHDLRTPLTVVRSYADLLARWGGNDPRVVAESSRAIGRAAQTMERLVNDLLLLARVDARPPLKTAPLALDELALETVQEAGAVAPAVAVELGPVTPVTVTADEAYLRRAVWALVDNAVKYGGGRVTVSVARDGGEAVLAVADNGPGIDAADLPRIFERFYRADRARSREGGFGLGLSLARGIVEAHGGRLEAESAPGRGSRFTIRLPAV